jgi:hypothetical protein
LAACADAGAAILAISAEDRAARVAAVVEAVAAVGVLWLAAPPDTASEGERRQHDDDTDSAGGAHGDLDVPASVGISPVVYSSVVRPISSTAAAGAP